MTLRSLPVAFTALSIAALTLSPSFATAESDTRADREEVVVTATRRATPTYEIAGSVSVVTSDDILEQADLEPNLGSILAATVPGLGPSTEAASNFGQDLRGRNYLVLIDGIPQSTPLRDGFRDLNTIDPSSIERIEVVRGGTAVYGFGATGGLVSIITTKPSAEAISGHSSIGFDVSTQHADDSLVFETAHRISGTRDAFDYVLSGSYRSRGGRFDANGERIPPNPLGSQGGFADTDQYDILGKFGYTLPGNEQRVELTVNHFDLEQDTDYVFGAAPFTTATDPTPSSLRTPAIRLEDAIASGVNVADPGTENTLVSLGYTHADLAGSDVKVQLYYGDQAVVFPKFPGFNQGEILSEKFGSRLTVGTPLEFSGYAFDVTWGFDYNHDETVQNELSTGATSNTVPNMTQNAYAGFAQIALPIGDFGIVRGGLRHEHISVDADSVAPNRFGNTVLGGTLEFDETLFNAGAVIYLTDEIDLYVSYSQGFSLADIGRVLSDAGPFGAGEVFAAEQFETQAETVDNYELGIRLDRGPLSGFVAVFYSDADNGATFDADLRLQKFSEEIWGVEGALDYRISDVVRVGGTFSWAEGERDSQANTVDLDNTRVSPEKLTAYVELSPMPILTSRLQVLSVGDRTVDTGASTGFASGNVDGYTLVDLTATVDIGPGSAGLAIRNLLNEDYFPAISQAFNIPSAYAKGPGRTVGMSYSVDW